MSKQNLLRLDMDVPFISPLKVKRRDDESKKAERSFMPQNKNVFKHNW